jgi:hypothetical protein
MKVIFLDFDGVLVTAHDRYKAGSPFCVFNLNRITDATGAKLVVSSSWRILFEMDELVRFLREWGVTGEVIGKTPVIHDVERGIEIQKWLKMNRSLNVTDIIILDDDSDMAHLKHELIKCCAHNGLGEPQVEAAIERLGNV